MKKIDINERLSIKSLFLLNKSNTGRNNKSTYLKHINNNISLFKKDNQKKIVNFRNKSFLNNSKFQSYLLNIGHKSYNNNYSKIENKLNFSNNHSVILTSSSNQNIVNNNNNNNNFKILKKLFPNLSELNIYSNFPLYPFSNNERKYNSYDLIKKEYKNNIKKKIYNYYTKNIYKPEPDKSKLLSKEINNLDNSEEKSISYDKNINNAFIKHWKFIQKKNENNKLSKKDIKKYFEDNLPLKITKLNLLNNKLNKQIQVNSSNQNSFVNIFKNKEINKYFTSSKPFPNINIKKENSFKLIKIPKNKTFFNKGNMFMDYNTERINNINNYTFSQQFNNIQSILSRNKKNSYEESNKVKYEEKGTDTNEEI